MRSNALTPFGVVWKSSVFERRSRITRAEWILLTVFDRCTLIRYEINNRVRAAAGEYECGRPFGIIETVEGRVEDVLLFLAAMARTSLSRRIPTYFTRLSKICRFRGGK